MTDPAKTTVPPVHSQHTEAIGHELSSPTSTPTIPGYEILGELGRGGMGVVYKARQIALNRLVAIKMLPGNLNADLEARARFRTEAEAAGRLQHPNIVQIFEVGEVAGRPYLALEYVPGGTLSRFLNRSPQPIALAAELIETLARAMHHAHLQGIVHRDLKPGNILLTGLTGSTGSDSTTQINPVNPVHPVKNLPKIADFGLAKLLNASDGPTRVGDVIGTPSYMAPEQAGGVTLKLTPAVDVYALGAILYEMLTGRPPFLGETGTQTVVQVLSQDPVAPRQLRPDCPRDLETICLKCLEKNPSKRYQSAEALANDLRSFQDGKTIVARPAGTLERSYKWARRNPAGTAAIGVGIVLLLFSVLYAIQLGRHNDQLRRLADDERKAREQSQARFQLARQAVKDLLAEVGARDLASVPRMDPVRRSLLEKAVASMSALLEQDRDNPHVKRELAQVEGDVAEIHEMLGDYAKAEAHQRKAVELFHQLVAQRSTDDTVQRELALAQMQLAGMLTNLGRRDEAQPIMEAALAIVEDLAARRPDDPDFIEARARIFNNRGLLFGRMNRIADAIRDFSRARFELESLANAHKDRPQYLERLAAANNNLGVIYNNRGEHQKAAEVFGKAAEIYRQLIASPNNRNFRNLFVVASRSLGYAEWWAGRDKKAMNAFRIALAEARKLASDFPHIPDYQHSVAVCLDRWGEMLEYDGKFVGFFLICESEMIKEGLLREQPKRAEYRLSLGATRSLFAWGKRRQKKLDETGLCERRAIEQFLIALSIDPGNAEYQDFLRKELKLNAETMLQLGRVLDAARAAEELLALVLTRRDDALHAASTFALCARLTSGSDSNRYAQRAWQQFDAAISDSDQMTAMPAEMVWILWTQP